MGSELIEIPNAGLNPASDRAAALGLSGDDEDELQGWLDEAKAKLSKYIGQTGAKLQYTAQKAAAYAAPGRMTVNVSPKMLQNIAAGRETAGVDYKGITGYSFTDLVKYYRAGRLSVGGTMTDSSPIIEVAPPAAATAIQSLLEPSSGGGGGGDSDLQPLDAMSYQITARTAPAPTPVIQEYLAKIPAWAKYASIAVGVGLVWKALGKGARR